MTWGRKPDPQPTDTTTQREPITVTVNDCEHHGTLVLYQTEQYKLWMWCIQDGNMPGIITADAVFGTLEEACQNVVSCQELGWTWQSGQGFQVNCPASDVHEQDGIIRT